MTRGRLFPVRGALAALAALAALLALTQSSYASSRVCRDLEGQLARASGGGAPSRQARKYQKAIAEQQAQIAKAERQMRRAGCSGGFFSRGNPANVCQSLGNTLDRMHRNLSGLERKHRQFGGTGRMDGRDRARLLAALDANGCRGGQTTARNTEPRRDSKLFESLFGRSAGERAPAQSTRRFPVENEERRRLVVRRGDLIEIQPQQAGTFRTLCVRTCDGYFFPVAYSTYADDLERDAAACSAMCPGTDVELYMHRTPGEETDQMVSMAGVPYTELPTAFRYREVGFARPTGCGCGAARDFSIIAGGQPAAGEEPAAMREKVPPLPAARPDPAADPETLANREGGLDVAAIRRLLAPEGAGGELTASVEGPTKLPPPGERKVRVVGPAFLPDPEEAIDLRVPVPNQLP